MMKPTYFSALAVAAVLAACQVDSSTPSSPSEVASTRTRAVRAGGASLRSMVAAKGGFVSSTDDRGVPSFIWSVTKDTPLAGETPVMAARRYLARFAPAYGLSPSDVEQAEVKSAHDLNVGHIVRFIQRAGGVEVYPSMTKVLMRKDLDLVAISDSLRRGVPMTKDAIFTLDRDQAIALSIADVLKVRVESTDLIRIDKPQGDFRSYEARAEAEFYLPQPARAKPIFYAPGEGMEPAYFVEFFAGVHGQPDSVAYRYIVSARDGAILDRRDLTHYDAFTYRVWAENTGDLRPFDGPHADFTPHPTGIPDGSQPAIIPTANLVTVEGFNTNPNNRADPWLAANASQTNGNNVDAYTDDGTPDGYSNGDFRASLTGPNTFDRPYDFTQNPDVSEDQAMATVTHLFYVINWMHDYWYDSGFDEAAGNAQRNNFGRGGLGGDPLNAEAQDRYASGSRNNASMSTPSDGLSPRMQVFAWRDDGNRSVTLSSTPNPLVPGSASFGPTNFSVTGPVVLVDDGAGVSTDGCEPILNNVAGAIALIDRGACSFVAKARNAQNAGAIGMLLANNRAGTAPGMGGSAADVTIGSLSITEDEGNQLKAALLSGPVTGTLTRFVGADRPGSLDSTLAGHEWGHYIHNRLADCGTIQCRGTGEGWGDFLNLHLIMQWGDDLDGAYGHAIWAARTFAPDGSYYGTRRTAYSTDFLSNALTFKHISDGEPAPVQTYFDPTGASNSEVHNTGEIWATMMFEAYVALLRPATTATDFDDARRQMTDYVVAGLMMMPLDATFTESRDAILAAAAASSPTDLTAIADAFAVRGAGSCAVSPPRNSSDNVGVVESFALQPRVLLGAPTLIDDVRSCDQDGVLDAEETGRLRIPVSNGSPADASGIQLTVTSTSVGVLFPLGNMITVPTIDAFSTVEVEIEVGLDANLVDQGSLALVVTASAAGACETSVTETLLLRTNTDETISGTTDDVEAIQTTWAVAGPDSELIWRREPVSASNFVWRGVDFGGPSNTTLTSPTLQASATSSLTITFDHRYRFEADAPDGSDINWDGAVIEISADDGQTWEDIVTYVDPGYRGVLTDVSGNPLASQPALVGTIPSWPNFSPLTLDLGTTFAGQPVRIRFRIGTDAAVGDFGIALDNFVVTGIDNTPFAVVGDDGATCPPDLVADAGPDVNAGVNEVVVLDGSGSASNRGRTITHAWTQTAGPLANTVTLDETRISLATPVIVGDAVMTFELTVDDGFGTAVDTVDVLVTGNPLPPAVVADAGADQTVGPKQTVLLDGSASSGGAGPLSFAWAQIDGPNVTLARADAAVATFEAPEADAQATLTFELTVSDGANTATAQVTIVVSPISEVTANAGADLSVGAGEAVVLDGSASSGPASRPLTFAWAQTAGDSVTFTSDRPVIGFAAPSKATKQTLTFELTVSDGVRTAVDTVDVEVGATPATPKPMEEEDGCGCTSTGSSQAGAPTLLALGALALLGLLRRRR